MNEQMQNTLSELINKTISSTEAVVEFGKQEIPLVIEQLLMWKMAEAVFVSIVTILIVVLFVWSWMSDYKRCLKTEKSTFVHEYSYGFDAPKLNNDTSIPYTIIGSLISLFCVFIAISNIKTIIYIWVAPKIYLLEYGANLAGKASGG